MANAAAPSLDDIIGILIESDIQIDDEQRNQIKTILTECNEDKNIFITKLIDSYFRSNTVAPPTTPLPTKTVGIILYRCINTTDLNTDNVIVMASNIIPKMNKGDQVDVEAVANILKENEVNGRVFAKGTNEYMNGAKFSRIFKPLDNWKDTKGVFSKLWREINRWELKDEDQGNNANVNNHSNSPKEEEKSVIPTETEDDQKQSVSSECKLSFTDCTHCQRTKRILIEYQKISSEMSKDGTGTESAKSQQITDKLFDDNYSAIDLLDDFQHIVREHNINDDPSRFDSCFEFMVKSSPEISCDIKECKAVRLHFRRRRGRLDGGNDGNVEIPTDYRMTILWQIHSFLVHSLETTMLTKSERIEIESEMKTDGEEDADDLQLKFVAEKMRQKSVVMEQIVDNPVNTKFVTESEFVENGNDREEKEEVEVPTSLDEDDIKYPEQRRHSMTQRDDEQILEEFCSVTSCDPAIAVSFLKKSDWNLSCRFSSQVFYWELEKGER